MRAVLVLAVVLLAGCTHWSEHLQAKAEYYEARKMQACICAQGGLRPYGWGRVILATGGATIEGVCRDVCLVNTMPQ